ncbi:MAG: cobalamin B12-binding domain-containing protein [Roseateles sp.]|nr:MAG: cobalamin B12-binding domain-containing protein [Roseateles sp.]
MAGWTTNRQAEQPLRVQPADSAAPSADPVASAPAALTLEGLLALPADAAPGRRMPDPCAGAQDPLARLVELEIIPRLMLLHRAPASGLRVGALAITPAHVDALTERAVHDDADSASRYVRGLLDAGATQEQIFLDLLTPCARHMGVLWEQDVWSFSEVTIGLWRLQRVLHELSARPDRLAPRAPQERRILLAAEPGTQHTFGVAMVAEFFCRAGWLVDCEPQARWTELRARLGRQWFDVFGLSISSSEGIPQIASVILDMRKASANPGLFVMVGGPMAAQMPDLARLCGADAAAGDANLAVALAQDSLRPAVRRA